jgi:hypothetical protein
MSKQKGFETISELTEGLDKGDGFVLVGNDTWLPRCLVDAQKRQQRKVSRVAENGIVWTKFRSYMDGD